VYCCFGEIELVKATGSIGGRVCHLKNAWQTMTGDFLKVKRYGMLSGI